jgi:hypothetical protein
MLLYQVAAQLPVVGSTICVTIATLPSDAEEHLSPSWEGQAPRMVGGNDSRPSRSSSAFRPPRSIVVVSIGLLVLSTADAETAASILWFATI